MRKCGKDGNHGIIGDQRRKVSRAKEGHPACMVFVWRERKRESPQVGRQLQTESNRSSRKFKMSIKILIIGRPRVPSVLHALNRRWPPAYWCHASMSEDMAQRLLAEGCSYKRDYYNRLYDLVYLPGGSLAFMGRGKWVGVILHTSQRGVSGIWAI
jgi:hypothetical protein